MPGCSVSLTTESFFSVVNRRRRATPVMTSIFENVSDISVCLGLCLAPPANAGVRSKQGAVQQAKTGTIYPEERTRTDRNGSEPSNCIGDRRQIQDVRQDDWAEGQSARNFDKRWPRAARREMKTSWGNPLARTLRLRAASAAWSISG